jgi:ankyrin repeat protein
MPIARDGVEQLQIRKLIYAVRTEDIEQVQKLCEKGVEHLVNYNDRQTGMTPLMWISAFEDLCLLYLLFISRAAVIQNNETMIQVLLRLGAHPDVIDFAGRTALMYAVEYGHIAALDLLRDAKANPIIQDLEGKGNNQNFQINK